MGGCPSTARSLVVPDGSAKKPRRNPESWLVSDGGEECGTLPPREGDEDDGGGGGGGGGGGSGGGSDGGGRVEGKPWFVLTKANQMRRRSVVLEEEGSQSMLKMSSSSSWAALQPGPQPHADYPNLLRLERDGYLLHTSTCGAVQFGIPPESIKDCMLYGLEVPTYYVIFGEMFDRECGLSTAEFEFPIYFNFFVKKRKVTILTSKSLEERIRTAFQETLFSPQAELLRLEQDFSPTLSKDHYPNFAGEGIGLDAARETLSLDDLVEFVTLKDTLPTVLGESLSIKMARESDDTGMVRTVFRITEFDELIAKVPANFRMRAQPIDMSVQHVFTAPLFGITVLGSSHGFDPKGKTTGFVLWLNRIGLMVDPPPDSSKHLERLGIAPSRIQGIVLTHCHADHDAGTFQKLLRQRQVKLYTTTTIKESFVRKYAAITGFEAEFLESLFLFNKVTIGEPLAVGCCRLHFFYSLHTIPCIGFHARWHQQSIAYSADTNYSPELINGLHERGIIGEGRRDQLLAFPWDATVVLHEMGVPPIHTADANLTALCEQVEGLRDRLFVVHAAANASKDLKQLSEMDTLDLPIQRCERCKRRELVSTFRTQQFMRPVANSRSVLAALSMESEQLEFQRGATILAEGEVMDSFFVIASGTAQAMNSDGSEGAYLYTTASLCERGIWAYLKNRKRLDESCVQESSVVARTNMSIIRVPIPAFVRVIDASSQGRQVWDALHLCETKDFRIASETIRCNSRLNRILEEQMCVLDFHKLLRFEKAKKGDIIEAPLLVMEGTVVVKRAEAATGTFRGISHGNLDCFPKRGVGRGALIGNINRLLKDASGSDLVVQCEVEAAYYSMEPVRLRRFLKNYPGCMLQLLDKTVMGGFRSGSSTILQPPDNR